MREEDTEAWLRAARKEHWAPPPQGGVKMSEVSLRRAREREVQPFPLQGPSPGTRHFNGEEASPTAPVPPLSPRPRAPPPRRLLPGKSISAGKKQDYYSEHHSARSRRAFAIHHS